MSCPAAVIACRLCTGVDAMHSTAKELRDLHRTKAEQEVAVIAALDRADAEAAASCEQALQQTDHRISELQAILAFDRARTVDMSVPELWCTVYVSERTHAVEPQPLDAVTVVCDAELDSEGRNAPLGLGDLFADVPQWSRKNRELRITGAVVATARHFFGILEGPRDAVSATFTRVRADSRHTNVTVLTEQFVESRSTLQGMQLSTVPDGIVAQLVDDVRGMTSRAERFVPASVLTRTRGGGHPMVTVPPTATTSLCYAVVLDSGCGAVHRPPRVEAAALKVTAQIIEAGGIIVDKFGDMLTAVFPLQSGSTAVARAMEAIYQSVQYAVQALDVGSVTVLDAPHATALGSGLRRARQLVLNSETLRRPVMISETAAERCNRARQPLEVFTVDCVPFYTPLAVGESRLEVPPEPELIGSYEPGPEPEEPVDEDTARFKTREGGVDVDGKRKANAFVRGGLGHQELRRLFRKLDVGAVGWVGKDQFRAAVATDDEFPRFLDAGNRLEQWLDRCNSIGDERLSFDEFCILCLRLQAQ